MLILPVATLETIAALVTRLAETAYPKSHEKSHRMITAGFRCARRPVGSQLPVVTIGAFSVESLTSLSREKNLIIDLAR